jgi:tryptophan synthase alpha chain
MSSLTNAFLHRPAFMPYFPLGFPTPEISVDVIEALARGGADLIEVGVPFSDPLADGPVVQQATQIALQQGMTVARALTSVAELRRRGVTIPLVLMGYYNPWLAYGLPRLVADAMAAGVSGFIVPDLPPEEAGDFEGALPAEMPLIRMLAPTSPPARAQRVLAGARGFIYMVAVTGITGERTELPPGLPDFLARTRAISSAIAPGAEIPLCVGFGIGTPAQAAAVGALADGIIVGSACVRVIGDAADPVATAEAFARSFKEALAPLAA